jgi:hypothetical protein
VGVIGGRHPARVDAAGLVTPCGASWSVDWWIGADDRWHLPAREPAVRQRRLGPGPVLETTVRIPSGNARHTSYGALVGGREATVVEIANDSPAPVALALAIRPYPVDPGERWAQAEPLRLDGRVVWRGRTPALLLPRPPREAGAWASGDVLRAVMAGGSLAWDGPVSGPEATAVAVYPLPHRSTLRLCILAPGTEPATAGEGQPNPDRAPDAGAVARGWRSVLGAAAGFQFPDPGLSALVEAARARLLLASPSLGPALAELAPGSGAVLAGLACGGHRPEVRAALDTMAAVFPTRLGGDPTPAAEIVAALAPAVAASDSPPAAALVEAASQLTHLVERAGDRLATSLAMRGLAQLATLAGDPGGAGHLDRLESRLGLGLPPAPGPERVGELAAAASPAGTWGGPASDDAEAAARFALAARSLLVDDSGRDLVLLARFPPAWRGGKVEVHRAPTLHGLLSYAVRWHGYRPALLWQLDGSPRSPVALRCPGLDPDWTSAACRGETLLGGMAQPLPPPPGAGESFS